MMNENENVYLQRLSLLVRYPIGILFLKSGLSG